MCLPTLLLSPPLVFLFLFSAFVVADAGVNVTANCTLSSFSWTFNSIGQSPCTVAGYMFGTCFSGSYAISPLPSPGYAYLGPTSDSSNTCQCSTVGFSLISACAACQEGNPFKWAEYTIDCIHILPPSQFPNPVPAGTYVPHWAILNVELDNNWESDESYDARDGPEYGPGAIFGASSVYTSFSSTSSASTSSATTSYTDTFPASAYYTIPPTLLHSGGHAGVAAGVSVGGLAITSIAVAAILYLRRRRSRAAPADVGASQPMLNDENDGTVVQPSPRPPPLTMKLYDPNDPTTFPKYQGGPRSLDIRPASQVTLLTGVESGSTPANMQTSQPHASGYRGFPMPSA